MLFYCISGVPKLNRLELEAACEEFSNIIVTYPEYTVFKGTLSSGVEISVASTTVKSAGDWSKASEMCFRKKVHISFRSFVRHATDLNFLKVRKELFCNVAKYVNIILKNPVFLAHECNYHHLGSSVLIQLAFCATWILAFN